MRWCRWWWWRWWWWWLMATMASPVVMVMMNSNTMTDNATTQQSGRHTDLPGCAQEQETFTRRFHFHQVFLMTHICFARALVKWLSVQGVISISTTFDGETVLVKRGVGNSVRSVWSQTQKSQVHFWCWCTAQQCGLGTKSMSTRTKWFGHAQFLYKMLTQFAGKLGMIWLWKRKPSNAFVCFSTQRWHTHMNDCHGDDADGDDGDDGKQS